MAAEAPRFGLYHGESILPPSKQKEKMTVGELQERYPFRSRLYGEVISDNESIGVSPEVLVRRLQMLNNLDRYITTHGGTGRARVLREKQLAVFKATRDSLEEGEVEGFVEAPTGFGKTILFSEIIRATSQRTLVVVPSRLLVEQTYQVLKQRNLSLDIGRYYSDRKEKGGQVMVTTYQSLVRSNGGVNPDDIDLLVLDEVHQSLTDIRIGAVGRFVNPVKLGFTATPEYTQDKRVADLLNNEIYTISLKEGVETGHLCSFSVYLAETNVDLSNVKIGENRDYDQRELEEVINIYSRNKSAVDLYKKLNEERSDLSKAVAYCVSIKHAQEVARVFNEAGVPAAAVWSDQDPKERQRIIEAYKKGQIKILTNVNVLTEGFDDPQAALCLNLRPTLSKVVAKQRGGRVLRLDPANPGKHAIVVDYMDRNENKKNLQVTFAQVAEGARIINQIEINGGRKTKEGGDKEDMVHDDTKKAFDLEGLHVITNSQEVLRIISEFEAERYESVPAGWESASNLAREVGMSVPTVRILANRYRLEHPEWISVFLNPNGVATEYLSPEFIDRMKASLDPSPKGWMTNGALADSLNKEFSAVKSRANKYRDKYPEWFKEYTHKKGIKREFYAPDLVKLLTAEINSQQEVPEGWKNLEELRKTLQRGRRALETIINKLRIKHADWISNYKDSVGKIVEHYSPELISHIQAIEALQRPAPEGWITVKPLAKIIGVDPKTIKLRLSKLRKTYPESFEHFKHQKGKILEYIAPQVVEILKRDFEK